MLIIYLKGLKKQISKKEPRKQKSRVSPTPLGINDNPYMMRVLINQM